MLRNMPSLGRLIVTILCFDFCHYVDNMLKLNDFYNVVLVLVYIDTGHDVDQVLFQVISPGHLYKSKIDA